MVNVALRNWSCLLSAVLLGVATVGCGGEAEEPTYPVTGTVTQNGTPIEGAAVTFAPTGEGRSAVGVTDSSGRYSLTTRRKDDGAMLGEYRVTVAKYEGGESAEASRPASGPYVEDEEEYVEDESAGDAPTSVNVLPAKYANRNSSGLTATVSENENRFDFELE